jgi:hypothetical protein
MGISNKKNLLDSYFDLTGWTENTFNSATAQQNLPNLTSTTGGVALISIESAPTAGGSTSLSTADFVDFRAPLFASSDGNNHPSPQFLSNTSLSSNLFSSSGVGIASTTTVDAALLNGFNTLRNVTNLRAVFVPANTTLSIRLASTNLVSSVTIVSKLVPFPVDYPISLFSLGSWANIATLSVSSASVNLTPLDVTPTQPLPPGFWNFVAATRFNAEAATTKTTTFTISRTGAGMVDSPYRLPIRTAAADTGSLTRAGQFYAVEHHPVSRVVISPLVSATNESYAAAWHIPYAGLNQIL